MKPKLTFVEICRTLKEQNSFNYNFVRFMLIDNTPTSEMTEDDVNFIKQSFIFSC